MRELILRTLLCGLLTLYASSGSGQSKSPRAYLGFDRNDYPGDDKLPALYRVFSYSGYWLNNPPGSTSNSWIGTRSKLQAAGFGFLVLFNGRTDMQIKASGKAAFLGQVDGESAVASARKEGFPAHTVIFLDQEEGGRLLPEQRDYLLAWVDAVNAAGFRAGVYCSGLAAREATGAEVITAKDIRDSAAGRPIVYWVTNDACPPSPGCSYRAQAPSPARSGVGFADVWQFAQSPKRKDFAGACHGYNEDGNCYPKGSAKTHIDLDTANSPDPSRGRVPPR